MDGIFPCNVRDAYYPYRENLTKLSNTLSAYRRL